MKVIQFTIPVDPNKTIILQEEVLPYFYPHLHRHREFQITYIKKGKGTLLVGNQMHSFDDGDVFILGDNMPHLFKSNAVYFEESNALRIHSYTIFFNPYGDLKGFFDLPESLSVKRFVEKAKQGFKISNKESSSIAQRIVALHQKSKGIEILGGFVGLLQLLSELKRMQTLATDVFSVAISENEGLRMNEVYQYTLTHYKEPIKINDVAHVAHLSPQSFCRYFKKHTRKTYIDFLNEIRIGEACKQLTEAKFSSIAEVAYDSGFSNVMNFNRVFKKYMKVSPSEFIRSARVGL